MIKKKIKLAKAAVNMAASILDMQAAMFGRQPYAVNEANRIFNEQLKTEKMMSKRREVAGQIIAIDGVDSLVFEDERIIVSLKKEDTFINSRGEVFEIGDTGYYFGKEDFHIDSLEVSGRRIKARRLKCDADTSEIYKDRETARKELVEWCYNNDKAKVYFLEDGEAILKMTDSFVWRSRNYFIIKE